LSEQGHTKIHSPNLHTDQKNLIKILDNTRSTYAFFAKKVILVEGDTDRALNALPASVVLANGPSSNTAYTTVAGGTPAVDANRPTFDTIETVDRDDDGRRRRLE